MIFHIGKYPVTSVAFDETGGILFTAGMEGKITAWDMRKQEALYTLEGHEDIITSLSLSPNGHTLLSDSQDNTVRTWNVQPFVAENRSISSYSGAPVGLEKNLMRANWNRDGSKIAAGSGDCTLVIWDVASTNLLYKLPGHRGCVNDVHFSPTDSIIVSGSSDRSLLLGQLNSC